MENQGTNEDDSQSDPHPEAGPFRSQTTQNSGSEVGHDMVTRVQGEIRYRPDMVTGVQGEVRYRPDMLTGATVQFRNGHDMVTRVIEETHNGHDAMTRVQRENLCGHDMVTGGPEEFRQYPQMTTATQEEISYCSRSTSSGKQKKARSTSQPQFRCENTPATIEAGQILLALQQLAKNSNSDNFNNNSNRISKLPKSLTTTMPTFDRKSEKFELFEDLCQMSLKIHNQLTEEDKKTISTLSCVVMRCRRSKTSAARTERIWLKF